MIKNKKGLIFFIGIFVLCLVQPNMYAYYDVNLIGFLNDIYSVSRHTTSFADCLKDHCSLKLFKTKTCEKKSLYPHHQKLLDEGIDLKDKQSLKEYIARGLRLEGMTIYTQSLWQGGGIYNRWKEYCLIPNLSTIKMAYVVAEYTKIPHNEVNIFNTHFDALIVPDPWLEPVYKSSGVTIPIFTLPLVLDLKSLHNRPVRKNAVHPFVFGFSGVGAHRKNLKLLISAFSKEFGNDENVLLVIHSRFKYKGEAVEKLLPNRTVKNIIALNKSFSRAEYEDFIANLSCYTILSKAEGFSITPREALAAGVPCVLSNNTAHKTICETRCVVAVKSEILEHQRSQNKGFVFNCSLNDTRKALRAVYENYDHYWKLAQKGREWTKEYLLENLQPKYLSLVKPSRVILGNENKVTNEYLMVASRTLFNKYKRLCHSTGTVFEERVYE